MDDTVAVRPLLEGSVPAHPVLSVLDANMHSLGTTMERILNLLQQPAP